jgi:hypothetical protein
MKGETMRRLLALASITLVFALAHGHAAHEDTITSDEIKPPPGFTALFNGKYQAGGQGAIDFCKCVKLTPAELAAEQKAADAKILPHWKAVEGVLINDGHGGNLATVKDYGNFELNVDWEIEPRGDSGSYLRGNPKCKSGIRIRWETI